MGFNSIFEFEFLPICVFFHLVQHAGTLKRKHVWMSVSKQRRRKMKKDSFSGFANDLKIFHPQQVFRTFQPMCFPCFKQKPEQHIVSLPRLKMVRSLKELLGRWFWTFLGGRGSVKVQFVMKERFNKKATEIFWGSHFENPHNPNKKL